MEFLEVPLFDDDIYKLLVRLSNYRSSLFGESRSVVVKAWQLIGNTVFSDQELLELLLRHA